MGTDVAPTPRRALVVDDSQAIRTIVGRFLRELGFEVSEAADGEEALNRVRAERPDLVLVDWNMPVMDGLELVRAVRANPDWERIQLMMVTTETEPAQIVRALGAGADEYLLKPFTRDGLAGKLALLGWSR